MGRFRLRAPQWRVLPAASRFWRLMGETDSKECSEKTGYVLQNGCVRLTNEWRTGGDLSLPVEPEYGPSVPEQSSAAAAESTLTA